MMIRDIIDRLTSKVASTQSKIRELQKERETRLAKKNYCGKCDKGTVYRQWPKIIQESWGNDFAVAMRKTMPNGYPDNCECIGGGKYSDEALLLDDEVNDTRDEIEKWQSRRAKLAEKVGTRIVDKGLHNYIRTGNEEEIGKFQAWINNHMRCNLIFVGKSGSGKSHLASGIANQLTCDERDFMYIDGYSLDGLNNQENIDSGNRDRSVERLSSADFLIIDDAGKSKMTPALFAHVWFPILNIRMINGLVTIFTFDKIVRHTWRESGIDADSLNALYNRIEAVDTGVPKSEFILLECYIAESDGFNEPIPARKRERADIYG